MRRVSLQRGLMYDYIKAMYLYTCKVQTESVAENIAPIARTEQYLKY